MYVIIDVMEKLGLTAEDVNAIYDESSAATSFTLPSDRVKEADALAKLDGPSDQRKLDDSDTEKDTVSSAWDEDDSVASMKQPQGELCQRHGLAVPRAGDRFYVTGSIRSWSRSHLTYITGGC